MSIRLSCFALVDPVADAVLLLPLAVDPCGDPRVEDEEVPGEAPAGAEGGVDPFEDAAPVGPGRQVAQRAEGAVHEPGRLVQLELAHVAFPQLELDARRGRTLPRLGQHRRRRVDPEHGPARLAGDRDRDAPVADRELDERALGLAGELDVEGDVRGHVRGPVVVDGREGVVGAQETDGIVARWTPRRSRAKHGPPSPRPRTRTRSRSCASATWAVRAR